MENLAQAFAPSLPGKYSLIARIDYDSRIVETNENDNEIRLPFNVKGTLGGEDDVFDMLLLN